MFKFFGDNFQVLFDCEEKAEVRYTAMNLPDISDWLLHHWRVFSSELSWTGPKYTKLRFSGAQLEWNENCYRLEFCGDNQPIKQPTR